MDKLFGGFVLVYVGASLYASPPYGEVDEWFKSHAWKACVGS
jgi:hypothetical protein